MMTIEEYLNSLIANYTFSDAVIERAMGLYDIKSGESAFQPERGDEWERKRDLASAVIYDTAASLVNGGGRKEQIGIASYTTMSVQTSLKDRAEFRNMAKSLRLKWGEAQPEVSENGIYDASRLWRGRRRAF